MIFICLVEKYYFYLSDKLEELPLDQEDIHAFSESKVISFSNKLKIIEVFDIDIPNEEGDNVDLGRGIFLEQNNTKEKGTLLGTYCNRQKEGKAIKLISSQVKYRIQREIAKVIRMFNQPYSRLAEKGSRPAINNNEYNQLLVGQLKKAGFIFLIGKIRRE
ncbi:hypothetical protein [Xanthovirga aplysinae]|uniref:hypothetical protein n=1 Tax=Xanthovirga aplysinae TaxID=2529853 RepID=UPI0012BB840E|nr:hypothetical protein [Xanthovirga aplysinae]MTI29324.1 hypothetical protein [Xanthovirga aplysinae]